MFNLKQQEKAAKPQTDKIDTIIGQGTSLEGNIKATGTVRVDGRLTGEIETEGNVIIGESGQLKGKINATDVTIAGLVEGNIKASGHLHIASSGKIYGDIAVETLIVEQGAKYTGNCSMQTEEREMPSALPEG